MDKGYKEKKCMNKSKIKCPIYVKSEKLNLNSNNSNKKTASIKMARTKENIKLAKLFKKQQSLFFCED